MKPSYCEQWHGTHWQNKQLDLCHFLPVFFLVFWLCRNPGSYVLESQARFATELCIHTQSWQIGEEGGDRMATNHLCPGYNIWWIRTCYSLWQPDTLIS
jgi:hypothetical protein